MKIFALLGMLSVSVCIGSAETLADYLKVNSKQFDKALKNKDMAAFGKLMKENSTADFVYIEKGVPGGKPMNREQMVATMAQSFKTMDRIDKVESKILSVKQNGDKGVAMAIHSITSTTKMPNDPKPHVVVYAGKSADEYRKVNGKWKLAKMTWLENKMTLDGKPFDPMAGQKQ